MSDLPTRARSLADQQENVWTDQEEYDAVHLLRLLADLCDTYREALEEIAGWGVHFDAKGDHSKRVVARARVALATGEQARVVEAEEEPRGENAH